MKLLLTSSGLSNNSIANALFELVGKPASETIVAFIPTAMNVEKGDKGWFINDLNNIKKYNYNLDIVDISALPKNIWLPRIKVADVLFFSGGNTSHLMYWLEESDLKDILPELLKTRVYAGTSAGSIATNPTLFLSSADEKIYYEENFEYKGENALNLVDFYIRPHFNSSSFPHAKKEVIEEIAKKTDKTIYAIDDQSAIKVVDDTIEIISEGEYFKFN